MTKTICIFDTSIASLNQGDEIIMDAINCNLRDLFPNHMVTRTLTHDRIGHPTYRMISDADYLFVGGTNLLSSNMNKYRQWKVSLWDLLQGLQGVVLMGVGWWQYQGDVNTYTKLLLKGLLSPWMFHSVRDSYTENRLRQAGFSNVLNTGCPTIWNLDEEHCKAIPKDKAPNVLFTLTDYKQARENDKRFVEILIANSTRAYFWPQGRNDEHYVRELGFDNSITYLAPRLSAFDELLADPSMSVDYVGTRLHAGIRAMQHKRRSIVVAVDNRATEMGRDFNICVVPRGEESTLLELINQPFETHIQLPTESINRWKSQFQ